MKFFTNLTRQNLLFLVGFIMTVLLAFFLLHWLLVGRFKEETNDAYVKGNIIQITAQIPGTVTALKADDDDYVNQNQPLVILDSHDTQNALTLAENKLAETVRNVRKLYNNLDELQANLNLRRNEFFRAQQDYLRRNRLKASAAIAVEDLQHAKINMQVASASFQSAQHDYLATQALVQGTSLINSPLIKQAAANLKQAYLNQQRTVVSAPLSGYVSRRTVQLGQQIDPGTPLMALIQLDKVWVEANFKEDQLQNIRIDQPVIIKADLYGNEIIYHGHVSGIDAGTGSVFSILPPQNATGNWIKVVQRIPVKITLESDELKKHPLRLGLSLNVTVITKDRSGKILASSAIEKEVSTQVFATKTDYAADQLIQKIIVENAGSDLFRQN